MNAATETTVDERTLSIDASPDTVWDFFVEPEKLTRWKGINAELEAKPGGFFRCEVIPGHVARGEFVESTARTGSCTRGAGTATKASRLERPRSPSSSPRDGNGTSLRFVHEDLPSPEAVSSHAQGWDHYLPRLELAAAGRDPGADPWVTEAPSM